MRRTLALETTTQSGTLAAFEGDVLLATAELDPAQRSARSLAPGMHALLGRVGWRPSDLQLVAVASGPGSFTGLRVGVTTAKVLAYAAGAELVGVNTLEAIAARAADEVHALWTVLDAHRGQVFAARFAREEAEEMRTTHEPAVLDTDGWLSLLQSGDVVSGPVLARLASRLPAGVRMAPPDAWHPIAAAIGHVALRRYAAGQRDDPFQLAPQYYRASAAEEKRKLEGART